MAKGDVAEFRVEPSGATLEQLPGRRSLADFGNTLEHVLGRHVATVVGAVLFLITAWPLTLVECPPFQDLPNHLAAVTVIRNPELYPGFVFNGFIKTNTALFAWLAMISRVTTLAVAAKLFTFGVLAANAFLIPRTVLELTGSRRRVVVASLFAWPMVHNWFVSMGMLDFALGVPLALGVLILLHRQRIMPTTKRAVQIAALSVAVWYAHVFALLVVALLVAIEVAIDSARSRSKRSALLLTVPLAPGLALATWSVARHIGEPGGSVSGFVSDRARYLPLWEGGYNLWAEWFYGFTWLSISSFVPCVVLTYFAVRGRRMHVPFFSPIAFLILGVACLLSPWIATNWFHVSSRFIPFFWIAALVRVPEKLPKWMTRVLVASGVLYCAGMGVDYVRLEREWSEFRSGVAVVPEGAKLLPLVFNSKVTSENTRSLSHAWGFYVVEKKTTAPLLFAHSRSFPVMYRESPDPQFNHLVLQRFAATMATPRWTCGMLHESGVVVHDCEGFWRERWAEFWRRAEPGFDNVLLWDAPPTVVGFIPPTYERVFEQGRLAIYARKK